MHGKRRADAVNDCRYRLEKQAARIDVLDELPKVRIYPKTPGHLL